VLILKRVNLSLSEEHHERLVILKSILNKPNFDETIAELIDRVFEELTKNE
jgi:hypothetical protein